MKPKHVHWAKWGVLQKSVEVIWSTSSYFSTSKNKNNCDPNGEMFVGENWPGLKYLAKFLTDEISEINLLTEKTI